MNVWKLFSLAARAALLRDDERIHRLGAVGVRRDGVLVLAANGPARNKLPAAHAEARLTRKLDSGSEVYVTRATAHGYGLARPCGACQVRLRSKGVRRAYYTVSDTEYGVLELSRG